jgi:hypothetical protein
MASVLPWLFGSLRPVHVDSRLTFRFICDMSTVAEIKEAIGRLSPSERAELEALVWPDWDRAEGDAPPGVREKLAEAAKGRFQPGSRSTIKKILSIGECCMARVTCCKT